MGRRLTQMNKIKEREIPFLGRPGWFHVGTAGPFFLEKRGGHEEMVAAYNEPFTHVLPADERRDEF